MRNIAIVIVFGLALSVSLADAKPLGSRGACAADIKAYCSGVQPGEGRIGACIKEHFKDLSEGCQARLAKAAAIGEACKADVKEHCSDIKGGRGRVAACIKSLLANVSDGCKNALVETIAGRR